MQQIGSTTSGDAEFLAPPRVGTAGCGSIATMRVVCVGAGPAGLYFSILTKLRDPGSEVTVLERNPRGATYGWGVTFSDDALDSFFEGDRQSAEEIRHTFGAWRDQLVYVAAKPAAHLGGYGFAIGRHRLLEILAARATELGVQIHYDHPVDDLAGFADADLILGADGANSRVREHYADHFDTSYDSGRNKYIWLGAEKLFEHFTYTFIHAPFAGANRGPNAAANPNWVAFHAYPYRATEGASGEASSTFIVECRPEVWHELGFDQLSPDETCRQLELMFVSWLDGKRLLVQGRDDKLAPWLNFTWVTNKNWYHGNVVLAGDAAHTTHYSIGNGTKLAIEDVLELDRQLGAQPDIPTALAQYQRIRGAAVRERQDLARANARWFENIGPEIWDTDPVAFSHALRDPSRPEPRGPRWLLHRATQLRLGRAARGWLSSAERRQRAREKAFRAD